MSWNLNIADVSKISYKKKTKSKNIALDLIEIFSHERTTILENIYFHVKFFLKNESIKHVR